MSIWIIYLTIRNFILVKQRAEMAEILLAIKEEFDEVEKEIVQERAQMN